jgi:hypothetical protein
MLFPHSARSCGRLFLCLATMVSLSSGLKLVAAETTDPAVSTSQTSAPDTSSSSDVQTAKVVRKGTDPYNRDFAVSAFAQDTNRVNGNSLRNGTTSSGGPMLTYRQTPRWWFGYEVNYGFTRYTDAYFFNTYRVKHDSNELSLAYLVDYPVYKGLKIFGTLGVGIMSLRPTQFGGAIAVVPASLPTQTVPLFVDSIGVEKPVTSRIGIRVQFRGDTYKDPDFKQPILDTYHLRASFEPAVGVYYKF